MKPQKISCSSCIVIALFCVAAPAGADLPPDFPQPVVTGIGGAAPGVIIGVLGGKGTATNIYNVVMDNSAVPLFYSKTETLSAFVMPNGFIAVNDDGSPSFVFKDESFAVVDSFALIGSYSLDGHDVKLLTNGHCLLYGTESRQMDMSLLVPGGRPDATVDGAVMQEIDANKQVVFQWRSLDHIPVTDSLNNLTLKTIDFDHVNSITLDPLDNNYLISARGLCQLIKISRKTGEIIWRLGGKSNDFTIVGDPPDATNAPYSFVGQHSVHRLANGNLVFFDNGQGVTAVGRRSYSRAVEYHLDETNMTATRVWEYRRTPDVVSPSGGSVQRFRNGNTLIGWFSSTRNGVGPFITEPNSAGAIAMEMAIPGFKGQCNVMKQIWNSPDLVRASSYQNVSAGQTYESTQAGVRVTINGLTGTGNELIVRRHLEAVRFPRFAGKAPQVLVERLTLAGTGIDSLAAELDFSLPDNSFCFDTPLYGNPAEITVHHRAIPGLGQFTPLTTVYDPDSGKLKVSTTQLGEFIFTYPDLPEIPLAPILFGQATNGSVNQAQPVVFEWTPKGFACSYQLQVATDPGFNNMVVDQSGLTVMSYTLTAVAADTKYHWRVRVSNAGGTGEWARASFRTIAPTIQVTAPNGNEGWVRGLKYFIRWNDNLAESVVIDLYKGGALLKRLATVANLNAYEWEAGLDLPPGSDYSIRLGSSLDPALFDDSDAVFGVDGGVVNQAPRFSGCSMNAVAGLPLVIDPVEILARASDPDGDAVNLTGVFSPSAQGATVALTDTINYNPVAGFVGVDTFEVELTDIHGANARGTVTITVEDSTSFGQNPIEFTLRDGKAEMVFRGLPLHSYTFQRSTDLKSWSDLVTANSGPDGRILFTDPSPPIPRGFYRARSN